MAHFEPRDEDVDMLLMLVEAAIPRQEAISRLKVICAYVLAELQLIRTGE